MDGLGDEGLVGVVEGATVSHVNCRCHVVTDGELRSVFLDGRCLLAYDVGEAVSERVIVVQLYTSGHAMEQDLAVGFGYDISTIRRWVGRWKENGFDGLLDKTRKCTPYKMKGRDGAVRRMVAEGLSNCEIARRLGVSEGTVRQALKRLGIRRKKGVEAVLPGLGETTGTGTEGDGCASVPETVSEVESVESELTVSSPAEGAPVPATDSDPSERLGDRALAAAGVLHDAPPLFGDAEVVPEAGVLLAVPAIVESEAIDSFVETYGTLGPAFHGLRTMVMTWLFMLLLRIRRPEHLRHGRPTDLGRTLGLDRVAEVKTVRRKLAELAGRGRSHELVARTTARRLETREDELGYVYLDGHVRLYCGKRDLPKTHIARLNCIARGETETWINDAAGEPLFVVTGELNPALTEELEGLVEGMGALLPEGVRPTLVFDRGGWSPKLFARLIGRGWDVITYRKGPTGKLPEDAFETVGAEVDGRAFSYLAHECGVRLGKVSLEGPDGTNRPLWMRQITRLKDDGRQTQVLTSRVDLEPAEVLVRMFSRWRQENVFKYMRDEFALDDMFSYRVEAVPEGNDRPNPARNDLDRRLRGQRAMLRELQAELGGEAEAVPKRHRLRTVFGLKSSNPELVERIAVARREIAALKVARNATPARIPADDMERSDPELRRIMNTLRLNAYWAETALFEQVRDHYARCEDEGRKLIVAAMKSPADLKVTDTELHVTLAAQSEPRRTKAIAALCHTLDDKRVKFPGTDLVMRFHIHDHRA